MSLHSLCLNSLNHELTLALACGKRLQSGEVKTLILTFGLLHLLVVSGAHLHFLNNLLDKVRLHKAIKNTVLMLFVATANFSPPILRAAMQNFLKDFSRLKKIKISSSILTALSYLACLPFAIYGEQVFSLNLSFMFGLFVNSVQKNKILGFSLSLYFCSYPVLSQSLGAPHFFSFLIMPAASFVIGSLLLPLSLSSIFSSAVEQLTISIWWKTLDLIHFFEIFLNFPKKPIQISDNLSNNILVQFNLLFFLATTLLRIFWKRRSYSL